jgi:Ti-type conjugative transfer relaxase TraA
VTPRITIGKGITGAINYARGEGRDPVTRQLNKLAPGEKSRVEWFGGTGFFWKVETAADIEQARREMEFDALNQKGGHCRLDCVHLSLSWRPGETPTRAHMEEQVKIALAAIGMANAKALYFAHGDEDYPHLHIVASKINPETGRAYDLKGNYLQLSSWAERYEAEHGGIISLRRQANNELRAAIADRDPGAVLEALTKQRSTFTPAQLEKALSKQIKQSIERAQFSDQILDHPEIVHLADEKGGPTTRYSTRAVIEAELYVLHAAEGLVLNNAHGVGDQQRAAILHSGQFAPGIDPLTGDKTGLTPEQTRAFHHVTGAEGLAIIDGQAGTGKSYTLAAVRQAYEAAGFKVIGLAPTNAVTEDMKADGFRQAATIHSELTALNNGRRNWDAKTVVIVDEAAMIDTRLMAMVTTHAHEAGAKLILVGDDRQLSSIDRGGMFGALKDRHGAAALSEVKRQHKLDNRRASEMMAEGNFHDALNIYNDMRAIHWTRTQPEARALLVAEWAKATAARPEQSRFVFAYTNESVDQLNAALRGVRKQRGELGQDHMIPTAHGRLNFAIGDRIQFTGTDKKAGIANGYTGTIEAIDGTHLAIKLDRRQAKTINFDAAGFDKFRHGYAGTIYKGQGKTLDETYLYHSEHWRSAASYVALTRHRHDTKLFVATNTAKDAAILARQMGRTEERRAASQFHYRQEIAAPPLTAAELLARFSADLFPRKESEMQSRDGTAQAANQNAREILDQAASLDVPTMQPGEPPFPGRYDEIKEAAAEATAPKSKADQVTYILYRMGDMHSHYDIEPRGGGYALVRTFEIDDDMLAEYGLPADGEQQWGWTKTLDEMHDRIIRQEKAPQAPEAAPEPRTMSRPEAWQQPAFSHDTFTADQWTAVYLPIPRDADELLLSNATHAAMHCFNEPQHPNDYSGQAWQQRRYDAGERVKELADKIEAILPGIDRRDERHEALIYAAEQADLVRAWQAPAFSYDTIDADRWTAVYLDIPKTADAELLRHARFWASELQHYALRDNDGPSVTQPSNAAAPQAAAAARAFELDRCLETLRMAESAPAPAAVQTPEPTSAPIPQEASAPVREDAPQPGRAPEHPIIMGMAEAIRRDPWNAVNLDIPADASAELLGTIAETAQDLRIHAEERAAVAVSSEETEYWHDLGLKADQRFDQAFVRSHEAAAREAWQQPAFSHETIRADAWTAVYLPIPQEADAALLTAARSWARDLAIYAERDGVFSAPLVNSQNYTREGNIAAASERALELDRCLETLRAASWTAEAAVAAEVPLAATDASGGPHGAAQPVYIHEEPAPAPVGRTPPVQISPTRGLRYFMERIGDRFAAGVLFLADMVSPPPKLTPQQAHEHLQAAGNIETLHAEAVAADQQAHEAEKDEQIFRADQQQQQADLSLAERFGRPVTREANLGREQDHERDDYEPDR